jgi:hypothetical protein
MGRMAGALLAGLLLGAVVGVGIARFVFGDEGRGVDEPKAHASSIEAPGRGARSNSSSDATSAAPNASSDPAAVEAARTPAAEPTSAPSDVVARVAAAAHAAPPATARKGSRSIKGRVVDADGAPIAGVVVRAERQGGRDSRETIERSTTGAKAPPPQTLDDAVRVAVQQWYDGHSDLRETRSDADGRYHFEDLRDGSWNVQGWLEGFELVPKTANHWAVVQPDATVDFTANAVAHASVTVKLPDGSVAPRAALEVKRIHAADRDRDRSELWTREQPTLPLLPGDWQVRATLGDPSGGPKWPDLFASDRQTITVEKGAAPPALTLQLHGMPGVRGHVKYADGKKHHAVVQLQALKPGEEPDLDTLGQGDGSRLGRIRAMRNFRAFGNVGDFEDDSGSEVDDEDSYLFKDLKPGRYVVGASHSAGSPVVAHAVVTVADSMVVQDLEMPTVDLDASVLVHVTDPAGHEVDDVNFSLSIERSQGSSWSGVQYEREDEGGYRLHLDQANGENLAKNWPSDVKVHLQVQSGTWGTRSVELTRAMHELQVQFAKPARLVATVAHYAGSGFEGRLSLAVEPVKDDEENQRGGRYFGGGGSELAEDGTQTFEPLEPGRVRVKLTLADASNERFGWSSNVVATLETTLVSGDNAATLTIPPLYPLTIEMKEGTKGQLRLRPRESNSNDWSSQRQRELDEHGRASFDDVVAGEYVAEFWGSNGQETMVVHVPTSGAVQFQPMAVNALQVWIRSAEGALAKAGFKSQDKVVSIDGKEFGSQAELKEAMDAAMKKDEARFGVLRGKERIELTFDPKLLQNPAGLGGTLWPTSR